MLAKADVSVHSNSVQEVQENEQAKQPPANDEQKFKSATDDNGRDLPAATNTEKTDSQPMLAREISSDIDGDNGR